MINILPLPTAIKDSQRFQLFKTDTNVFCAPTETTTARLLITKIGKIVENYNGKILPLVADCDNLDGSAQGIYFISVSSLGDECYELKIKEGKIMIFAGTQAGFYYGSQSLLQLFPKPQLNDIVTLPQIHVTDSPKYAWRGLMLDEARHFFGKDEVMRLIDILSEIKINKFHWHLTDDQGFRLQLDCYPQLTAIGSKRANTQLGGFYGKSFSGQEYSAYYTKDEITEVIEYARLRAVEIIPEISMPGHATAMIAALPSLQCTEKPLVVSTTFGNISNLICATNPHVYDILENIITEVGKLFPSKYIHLGGNDIDFSAWESCPQCTKYMQDNNFKTSRELLGAFFNRMNDILRKIGKTTIIYSSAYSHNLDGDIILQYNSVTQLSEVVDAYKTGRKIILSPPNTYYLDYPNAFLAFSTIYKSSLPPKEFSDSSDNILGVEAALWSEWIYEREKIDVCLFPRIHAVAEKSWSNCVSAKNFKQFASRVQFATDGLARNNVTFYRAYCHKPNIFKRAIIRWQYLHKDQYLEVKQNRKLPQ